MEVNKVVYNGNTLIDLTSDTVTADKLLLNSTAHGADGKIILGTLRPALVPCEYYDYNIGYVDNGTWKYENPTNTFEDIYRVQANHVYFLTLGGTVGSRFRAMFTTVDVTTKTSNVTGTAIINKNNPVAYDYAPLYKPSQDGYILCAKDNIGHSGLYSYLCDMTYYLFG